MPGLVAYASSSTLKESGLDIAEISEAANGKEGLAVAQTKGKDIDLILSDWNMPEMSGLEMVKAIRQVYILKDIPIVMITTEASVEMIKEARDAGATGYVTKPFTPEKIREKLNAAIEMKGTG